MELREALRMLRSEIGLTQTELAEAVNVGYSAESRWENKNTRPNKASSLAILGLAKKHAVSAPCLDALTSILLASRADDGEDRKRMEAVRERMKLEQRELLTSEQLKAAIDNLDLAIIGHRIFSTAPGDVTLFYHNRRYAEIFGYTEKEFIQRSRKSNYFSIPAESRETYLRMLKKLLDGKLPLADFVMTIRGLKSDHSKIWLEVKGVSLKRYSYGHELFISCRDVTDRVETERRCAQEAAVREATMQHFYAYYHCDLTANTTVCCHSQDQVMGRQWEGASVDALFQTLADAMPEGKDKEAFLRVFSREALLAAAGRNEVYGWAKGFNLTARRWMRMDRVLLQNPYTGHAEAAVYCYDIQDQVFSEKMMRIVADRFFEFIGLIDAQDEMFEAYYYANKVFHQTAEGRRFYPQVCEEKLRRYASPEDWEAQSAAVSLDTVRHRLAEARFYTTVLRLREYGGAMKLKRVTYTYLDETRTTIVMAQSDMTNMEQVILGGVPRDRHTAERKRCQ